MSPIALAVPRQRTRATSKGFTLLEIMVVVAIIAIIASIIAPNFNYARGKAQVSQVEVELQAIATAVELYHNDYGVYPLGGTGITNFSPSIFGGSTLSTSRIIGWVVGSACPLRMWKYRMATSRRLIVFGLNRSARSARYR